ncbi:Cell cycle checkpoint protein rad17 [Allomyces javanicus]|nr:Cell cycle checkpoint protein rad17 [Allomyces javanicus]
MKDSADAARRVTHTPAMSAAPGLNDDALLHVSLEELHGIGGADMVATAGAAARSSRALAARRPKRRSAMERSSSATDSPRTEPSALASPVMESGDLVDDAHDEGHDEATPESSTPEPQPAEPAAHAEPDEKPAAASPEPAARDVKSAAAGADADASPDATADVTTIPANADADTDADAATTAATRDLDTVDDDALAPPTDSGATSASSEDGLPLEVMALRLELRDAKLREAQLERAVLALEEELARSQSQSASFDRAMAEMRTLRSNMEDLAAKLRLEEERNHEMEAGKRLIDTEYESLSVQLFEQANALVKEERILRSHAERKTAVLEQRLAEANSIVESLRSELAALKDLMHQQEQSFEHEIQVQQQQMIQHLQEDHDAADAAAAEDMIVPSDSTSDSADAPLVVDAAGNAVAERALSPTSRRTTSPPVPDLHIDLVSSSARERAAAKSGEEWRSDAFPIQFVPPNLPGGTMAPPSPGPRRSSYCGVLPHPGAPTAVANLHSHLASEFRAFLTVLFSPVGKNAPYLTQENRENALYRTKFMERLFEEDVKPTINLPGLSWLQKKNLAGAVTAYTLSIQPRRKPVIKKKSKSTTSTLLLNGSKLVFGSGNDTGTLHAHGAGPADAAAASVVQQETYEYTPDTIDCWGCGASIVNVAPLTVVTLGETDTPKPVCKLCRAKLVTVCQIFSYVRMVGNGILPPAATNPNMVVPLVLDPPPKPDHVRRGSTSSAPTLSPTAGTHPRRGKNTSISSLASVLSGGWPTRVSGAAADDAGSSAPVPAAAAAHAPAPAAAAAPSAAAAAVAASSAATPAPASDGSDVGVGGDAASGAGGPAASGGHAAAIAPAPTTNNLTTSAFFQRTSSLFSSAFSSYTSSRSANNSTPTPGATANAANDQDTGSETGAPTAAAATGTVTPPLALAAPTPAAAGTPAQPLNSLMSLFGGSAGASTAASPASHAIEDATPAAVDEAKLSVQLTAQLVGAVWADLCRLRQRMFFARLGVSVPGDEEELASSAIPPQVHAVVHAAIERVNTPSSRPSSVVAPMVVVPDKEHGVPPIPPLPARVPTPKPVGARARSPSPGAHAEGKDLVVHSAKVNQVRQWLTAGYRRSPLLVIKGPTGSGKTTTLTALASDLGLTIREWVNPVQYADARVSPFHDLAAFLFKDAKYAPPTELLILKDLPIFTKATLATFHARLAHLLKSPAHRRPARLVLIVTEFNLPHELTRRRGSSTDYYDVPDVRDLIPDSLMPWVDVISFNPVAPTLVTKALRRVCDTQRLPARDIKSVVETANGDLRHALNCLQFIHVLRPSRSEADTLAEQHHKEFSKSLFSSLGRVLYEKRVTPSARAVTPSATPPSTTVTLPPHLAHWARAPLEVECAAVLDHLTVAPETYALFVHANVDQFITRLGARVWVADAFATTDMLATPARELARMHAVTLAHGVHDQVLDVSWADLVDDDDDDDWTREDDGGAGTPPPSSAPSSVVEPAAAPASSSQSSSSATTTGGARKYGGMVQMRKPDWFEVFRTMNARRARLAALGAAATDVPMALRGAPARSAMVTEGVAEAIAQDEADASDARVGAPWPPPVPAVGLGRARLSELVGVAATRGWLRAGVTGWLDRGAAAGAAGAGGEEVESDEDPIEDVEDEEW